jgi:butyrate kinase
MLAWKFALAYGKPAYTLNPTNVDEYCDYARLTGIRGLYRVPHSHVLNPKAVAEAHAASMGKSWRTAISSLPISTAASPSAPMTTGA